MKERREMSIVPSRYNIYNRQRVRAWTTSTFGCLRLSELPNIVNPKHSRILKVSSTNQRELISIDSYYLSLKRLKMIPRVRRLPLGRRGLATPAQLPTKDCRSITPPYPRLLETLEDVRRVLPKGSKLTFAEKILYSHLRNPEESLGGGSKIRGEKYLKLRPDRVAMQVKLSIYLCKHTLTCRMHQHKWLYYNS